MFLIVKYLFTLTEPVIMSDFIESEAEESEEELFESSGETQKKAHKHEEVDDGKIYG